MVELSYDVKVPDWMTAIAWPPQSMMTGTLGFVCAKCGALVLAHELHEQWHGKYDAPIGLQPSPIIKVTLKKWDK